MTKYRIYRTDPNNIAIQREKGKRWVTISYHGHSLKSLVRGLDELVLRDHKPEDVELLKQLEKLELVSVSGYEMIEELVEGRQ